MSPVKGSTRSTFRVASNGLVVGDDIVVHSWESRVLIDIKTIVGSASFGRISSTGCVALRFIDLGTKDGSTTETFSVIFESGISVVISLAESYTSFNGHILVIETLIEKSIRVGTA